MCGWLRGPFYFLAKYFGVRCLARLLKQQIRQLLLYARAPCGGVMPLIFVCTFRLRVSWLLAVLVAVAVCFGYELFICWLYLLSAFCHSFFPATFPLPTLRSFFTLCLFAVSTFLGAR